MTRTYTKQLNPPLTSHPTHLTHCTHSPSTGRTTPRHNGDASDGGVRQFLGPQFKGVGICAINMDDDISEYIRVLFITLSLTYATYRFAVPLGVITFLHVRVSVVLRGLDPAASVSLPTRRESRSQDSQQEVWSLHDNRFFPSTMMTEMDSRDGFHYHDAAAVHQLSSSFYTPTPTTTSTTTAPPHTPTRSSSSRGARAGEAEMIVLAERRTQRYLVTIVTTFALCLSPLMILRLVKNMVLETTENSGHFDITFITFVWVAFLPTLTTPVFYAAWKMPSITRYKEYSPYEIFKKSGAWQDYFIKTFL
ncbi:putative 7 transmembrane receptor (rhodopsin family)-containing protein 1 [Homarus americanus]|uniref:Putative 7 transmembrane receptor (Rhodopsin family)-containing protein 1 n=1 Tax=Homarus americanus TaxID=6706 RepID=A0A8J5MT17_HOMAM|nr:putative 7 transmembrane receptor (rhodopsin family)-containing protein 1 [Homarus americanus]